MNAQVANSLVDRLQAIVDRWDYLNWLCHNPNCEGCDKRKQRADDVREAIAVLSDQKQVH